MVDLDICNHRLSKHLTRFMEAEQDKEFLEMAVKISLSDAGSRKKPQAMGYKQPEASRTTSHLRPTLVKEPSLRTRQLLDQLREKEMMELALDRSMADLEVPAPQELATTTTHPTCTSPAQAPPVQQQQQRETEKTRVCPARTTSARTQKLLDQLRENEMLELALHRSMADLEAPQPEELAAPRRGNTSSPDLLCRPRSQQRLSTLRKPPSLPRRSTTWTAPPTTVKALRDECQGATVTRPPSSGSLKPMASTRGIDRPAQVPGQHRAPPTSRRSVSAPFLNKPPSLQRRAATWSSSTSLESQSAAVTRPPTSSRTTRGTERQARQPPTVATARPTSMNRRQSSRILAAQAQSPATNTAPATAMSKSDDFHVMQIVRERAQQASAELLQEERANAAAARQQRLCSSNNQSNLNVGAVWGHSSWRGPDRERHHCEDRAAQSARNLRPKQQGGQNNNSNQDLKRDSFHVMQVVQERAQRASPFSQTTERDHPEECGDKNNKNKKQSKDSMMGGARPGAYAGAPGADFLRSNTLHYRAVGLAGSKAWTSQR